MKRSGILNLLFLFAHICSAQVPLYTYSAPRYYLDEFPDTLNSFKSEDYSFSPVYAWDDPWNKRSDFDLGTVRVFYYPSLDVGPDYYGIVAQKDSGAIFLLPGLVNSANGSSSYKHVFDAQLKEVNGEGTKELLLYYTESFREYVYEDSPLEYAFLDVCYLQIWDLDSARCIMSQEYKIHFRRELKEGYVDSLDIFCESEGDGVIEPQWGDGIDTVTFFKVSKGKLEVYSLAQPYSAKPVKKKACTYRLFNGVFVRTEK